MNVHGIFSFLPAAAKKLQIMLELSILSMIAVTSSKQKTLSFLVAETRWCIDLVWICGTIKHGDDER